MSTRRPAATKRAAPRLAGGLRGLKRWTEGFKRPPGERFGMSEPTKIVLGAIGASLVVGVLLLAGIAL
jgi:hypothetical protein